MPTTEPGPTRRLSRYATSTWRRWSRNASSCCVPSPTSMPSTRRATSTIDDYRHADRRLHRSRRRGPAGHRGRQGDPVAQEAGAEQPPGATTRPARSPPAAVAGAPAASVRTAPVTDARPRPKRKTWRPPRRRRPPRRGRRPRTGTTQRSEAAARARAAECRTAEPAAVAHGRRRHRGPRLRGPGGVGGGPVERLPPTWSDGQRQQPRSPAPPSAAEWTSAW